jgi:hypothetical protein
MGFLAAAAPALTTAAPYISAGTAIVAGRQASTVGAYNKAIADRNFRVKVQEAERIQQQKNLILLDLIKNLHSYKVKQKLLY